MNDDRRSARLMLATTFCMWFAQYGFWPYVNPALEEMGATATMMGLVGGVYGLSQTIARIPLGIAADRFGQKPFLIAGGLLSAVACAGMYLCYSPAGFFAFRLVSGLGASTWVVYTVAYSGFFPKERSASAIAGLNVAFQLGRLMCYVLMGPVVSAFGRPAALLASGAMGVAATGLCWGVRLAGRRGGPDAASAILSENAPATQDAPAPRGALPLKAALTTLFQQKHLLACTGVAILVQVFGFATFNTFAVNHANSLGASAMALSAMNVSLMVPILVGNALLARVLLKRFSARWLVAIGLAILGVYAFAFPCARTMTAVCALQAVAGVGNFLTFPVLLGVCLDGVPQRLRNTAMGFFQALYGLGMTLGPVVMGALIDHSGLTFAFQAMAVFSLATIPVDLLLLKRVKTANQKGANA